MEKDLIQYIDSLYAGFTMYEDMERRVLELKEGVLENLWRVLRSGMIWQNRHDNRRWLRLWRQLPFYESTPIEDRYLEALMVDAEEKSDSPPDNLMQLDPSVLAILNDENESYHMIVNVTVQDLLKHWKLTSFEPGDAQRA